MTEAPTSVVLPSPKKVELDKDEAVVQLTSMTSDNGSLRGLELTTSTGRHFSFGDVSIHDRCVKRCAIEGARLAYCSGRNSKEGNNITFHWVME